MNPKMALAEPFILAKANKYLTLFPSSLQLKQEAIQKQEAIHSISYPASFFSNLVGVFKPNKHTYKI